MVVFVPAPSDPIIAALGLGAGALTLWGLARVLRAGKPRPGVAMFAKPFVIVVILLDVACVAATLAGWRDLRGRPGQDPTGLIVVALGALFFLWGTLEALTLRLEWDADGFRLRRFLHPDVSARWEDVEDLRVGRNQVSLGLRAPARRRVAVSRFLVGLQAFVNEAAQRTRPDSAMRH